MSEPCPPSRRVAIVALGTRGDVEPAVRLGTALRDRGDQVVVATLADGAAPVERAGLRPAVVGAASAEVMWWRRSWARALARRQSGLMYLQTRTRLARHAEELAATLSSVVVGADLVVCGLAAAELVPVLHRLGLPARLVLHAPLLPHPGGTSTWSPELARLLPRPVEAQRQALMWGLTRSLSSTLARALARRLQGAGGGRGGTRGGPDPLPARPPLLATSPALDPHPAPGVVQTGWWADPSAVRPLPVHVDAWLTRHPDAVLLSLGSLAVDDPDDQVARLVEVARRADTPAVVQVAGARSAGDPGGRAGAALVVGEVDHRALLPRVRAVVHHGGSGTTHSAVVAGRPQVVVPVLGDQSHYGRQVRRTGVGTVVRARTASVGVLSRALRTVLEDPGHERTAREMAAAVRDEDGLGRAVRELTLSDPPSGRSPGLDPSPSLGRPQSVGGRRA